MSRRRTRAKSSNRMAATGILAIVMIMCAVFGAGIVDGQKVLAQKTKEEEQLRQQLKDEKNRTKELEEQKAYVQSKEYIEEKARSFGYVYKDEEVFIPEDDH